VQLTFVRLVDPRLTETLGTDKQHVWRTQNSGGSYTEGVLESVSNGNTHFAFACDHHLLTKKYVYVN